MKRILIIPAVMVLGAWGPCRPPTTPPPPTTSTTVAAEVTTTTVGEPETTTTVPAEVCLDPALIVHADVHGEVTVHYADGPNGPHPVGWSGADGCIHPY